MTDSQADLDALPFALGLSSVGLTESPRELALLTAMAAA